MELTKKDKKHIEERVRKLSFRIVDESREYMKLYNAYTPINLESWIMGLRPECKN